jgi:hypothetical protein
MKKLLLLLFLFSISSNVFADEFEEFEKMAERKFMSCLDDENNGKKYSTDGENLYGWDNKKLSKVETELEIKQGAYRNEVTKKPDELKFIVKTFSCINFDYNDETPCSTRDISASNLIYTETTFIDFENVNVIFKEIREGRQTLLEIVRYTCELGDN